jgi:L-threonylcarbamoyladenylate synthase
LASESLIAALRAGLPVLFPTDTVYGLASAPDREAVARLYELKGRSPAQPTALLAASADRLVDCVPELGEHRRLLDGLLPGPYTLVLPNPARRYAWLAGSRPDALGVRVPVLTPRAAAVLDAVGCVVATSANEPGGPDPLTLADVPERLRARCPALDEGPLGGVPSTVLDVTGSVPRVLREGAVPAAEALERVRAALTAGGSP